MKKLVLFISAICLFSFSLLADSVTLIGGQKIEGKINHNDGVYTIVTEKGKIYQFREKEIIKVNDKVIAKKAGTNEKTTTGNPVILMTTSFGDMKFELYEDAAPNTVANMIQLAENGFYKGMSFHRVINNFMAQGGCPNSKKGARGTPGTGGPGYKFADETRNGKIHDGRGILSMANSGPNTNGSQFFVCFTKTPWLNGKHTVFGKIIEGLDVLDKIEAIGSRSGRTSKRVDFDIKVLSKRDHTYSVKKL